GLGAGNYLSEACNRFSQLSSPPVEGIVAYSRPAVWSDNTEKSVLEQLRCGEPVLATQAQWCTTARRNLGQIVAEGLRGVAGPGGSDACVAEHTQVEP